MATYHVLTKRGDATREVEAGFGRASAGEAGVHRYFYVSRADQTVVMAADADAPIARYLRELGGWEEPGGAVPSDA